MIAATQTTHGVIGTVAAEGCNLYVWNATEEKWQPRAMNMYTESTLPTSADGLYIPDGTIFIILPTGEQRLWINE